MEIAVTAASGQLGSAIVRQLKAMVGAEKILALARTPENAAKLGVPVLKADYDQKEDFLAALPGTRVLLIVSGMDQPDKRIRQHRNIIKAAKESGVQKIVYTSIAGAEGSSSFDPIVQSNRQTEEDIRESGLQWSIGRNGIYIEPDVAYIEHYKKDGKIANCAGTGLCSYTTRYELAFAYSQMILKDDRNGKIFNLTGEAISQDQLCQYLNQSFGTNLYFEDMSPADYLNLQLKNNGEFLGPIIAGIYAKIRQGEFEMKSDYMQAAGRPHISWEAYFASL